MDISCGGVIPKRQRGQFNLPNEPYRDPAGRIYGEKSVEGVVGAASPPLGRAVYHGVCTAKWVIVKRDVTTRGQRMVCGPSSLYL